MWLALSDDFVVHQGLLSQDISQVSISPVCHDGFVLERLLHLLVDVEDGPVLVYSACQGGLESRSLHKGFFVAYLVL